MQHRLQAPPSFSVSDFQHKPVLRPFRELLISTCELGDKSLFSRTQHCQLDLSHIAHSSLVTPLTHLSFTVVSINVWGNLFTQDSSTLMEHLFFSKVLLLLPNFPAGLTEAHRSQVTCLGQTVSVAWNRLEPMILLSLYLH